MRLAGVVWWVVFMLMCDEMQLGQGGPPPPLMFIYPSSASGGRYRVFCVVVLAARPAHSSIS